MHIGQIFAQFKGVESGNVHPVELHIVRGVVILGKGAVHQNDIAGLCSIMLAAVFQTHRTIVNQHQQQVVHIIAADLIAALAVVMPAEIDVIKQPTGRRTDGVEKDFRAGQDAGFVLAKHKATSQIGQILYYQTKYSTIGLHDKYFRKIITFFYGEKITQKDALSAVIIFLKFQIETA